MFGSISIHSPLPLLLSFPQREVLPRRRCQGTTQHEHWDHGKEPVQRHTLIKEERSWNPAPFGGAAIHLRDTSLPTAAFRTASSLGPPWAPSLGPRLPAGSLPALAGCPESGSETMRRNQISAHLPCRPQTRRRQSDERGPRGREKRDRRNKGMEEPSKVSSPGCMGTTVTLASS